MYLYDNDKSLPDNFQNAFSWRGVYVMIEEKQIEPLPTSAENTIDITNWFVLMREDFNDLFNRYFVLPPLLPIHHQFEESVYTEMHFLRSAFPADNRSRLRYIPNTAYRCKHFYEHDKRDDQELPIYEIKQSRKRKVAKSASSGHFNTLPKRSNVDKFKYRSGLKAQKYR